MAAVFPTDTTWEDTPDRTPGGQVHDIIYKACNLRPWYIVDWSPIPHHSDRFLWYLVFHIQLMWLNQLNCDTKIMFQLHQLYNGCSNLSSTSSRQLPASAAAHHCPPPQKWSRSRTPKPGSAGRRRSPRGDERWRTGWYQRSLRKQLETAGLMREVNKNGRLFCWSVCWSLVFFVFFLLLIASFWKKTGGIKKSNKINNLRENMSHTLKKGLDWTFETLKW